VPARQARHSIDAERGRAAPRAVRCASWRRQCSAVSNRTAVARTVGAREKDGGDR